MDDVKDQDFLKQALLIAEYSPEEVSCGAVIVIDGQVVSKAFNSQKADHVTVNHAEIKALGLANKELMSRTLKGATVYCSCEPCVMCLAALSFAKVSRIVFVHTMRELFPNDPISKIDTIEFVQSLNYVPALEQIELAE